MRPQDVRRRKATVREANRDARRILAKVRPLIRKLLRDDGTEKR